MPSFIICMAEGGFEMSTPGYQLSHLSLNAPWEAKREKPRVGPKILPLTLGLHEFAELDYGLLRALVVLDLGTHLDNPRVIERVRGCLHAGAGVHAPRGKRRA